MPRFLRPWLPSAQFASLLLIVCTITPAQAADWLASTHLVELRQGSPLSLKAGGSRSLRYDSSEGAEISMNRWYSARWIDFHVGLMTQINRNLGITWGFSTGEKAEKYVIAPSWKLGFVYTTPIHKNGLLTFSGQRVFSGRLKEKSCEADYGEIGGIRRVNCRLAATPLTPEETLAYNFNEKPTDRIFLSLQYRRSF